MQADPKLAAWLASVAKKPYAFVMGAFPWGVRGTPLERKLGPEQWQIDLLRAIEDGLISVAKAIRLATASGHGVGKSALVGWLILWGISTCVDARGIVTANTEPQLRTKTWPELGKWFHMFIAKDMFDLTATSIASADKAHSLTWRIDMIPWSKERPEAFAGLHNQGRRIVVIFDEASAIEDIIWETTEGALTDSDTEIIWAVFGNPTRNTGRFKECFRGGKFEKMWRHRQVDSRTVSFTSKAQIQEWIDSYGEDSDFVRIRVLGVFPRIGELEFFNADELRAAMLREVEVQITDPVALGVDVARFGQNESVIFPRKGRDARLFGFETFRGLTTVELAQKVFDASQRLRADGLFIDGGGVGGGVVDNVRNMHLYCWDIQFGGKADVGGDDVGAPGEKYANKRAEMYGRARAWVKTGALPNDEDLFTQLMSITYTFNRQDQIILTSKEQMMKDGKPSPDKADAFVLTFAYPLASHAGAGGQHWPHEGEPLVKTEYNPFDPKHMEAA